MFDNQNSNSNNGNNRPENKGFTVFSDGTYVAYITIAEFDRNNKRLLDEEIVAQLQKPHVMAGLIADSELRPFAKNKTQDTSSLAEKIANFTVVPDTDQDSEKATGASSK